ncbi:hypothetical protein ES288_A07G110800v1 [Gossypium darwinii]|nr:hypothetical protein ES288_A07G110800v1 [Gossypium darwinii]
MWRTNRGDHFVSMFVASRTESPLSERVHDCVFHRKTQNTYSYLNGNSREISATLTHARYSLVLHSMGD